MKEKKISIKEMVAAGQFRQEKEYWLERLSGQWVRSAFPLDHNRSVLQSAPVAGSSRTSQHITFEFPLEINTVLLKLSNHSHQKLHMILVALVTLLLRKYSRNQDIILGAPIYKQEIEGEFINTVLALRNNTFPEMTFKELLVQVRQTLVEASKNQNYPLETLLYHLDIPESQVDFPLFDVAVLLENIHDKRYIHHLPFNICFSFSSSEDRIRGKVGYNDLYYTPDSIHGIIHHFITAAAKSLNNVNLQLNHIELILPEEKEQLLYRFNNTKTQFSGGKSIHRGIEEQVARTPDHIAVYSDEPCKNSYITYIEINARSNRLARKLRSAGLAGNPGETAAIMVQGSSFRVIAMLAVLKAGAAYLPLDARYPEDRIRYMLRDNGAKMLLLGRNAFYGVDDFASVTPVETVLDVYDDGIYTADPANLEIDASPSHLAYVMYTSGTTGKPKGVMIEHGHVLNTVHWFSSTYHVTTGSRILGITEYTFDPSVEDMYGALLYGGTLYTCGADLVAFLEDLRHFMLLHRITLIDYIPQVLNQLLSHQLKLDHLSVVISGGEKLEDSTKDQILDRGYTLYNHYGPTEVTVDALAAACSRQPATLGTSIANTRCYIFDSDNHLAPIGVPGELCVAGSGIARGYLNNVELTNGKFTENPCIPTERIYRTGDLARRLPGGDIQFMGRIDQQLKIRGFRVEPGEIENCMLKHKEINNVVVIPKEDKNGEKYLCAYFVALKELDLVELRDYLADYLTDYMIPSHFIQMERIPVTSGGKTDLRKLPEPDIKAGEDYVAPRNEKEETLADIWADVLGIEKQVIGIDNNFFHLGGHSLKVTMLADRIHKTMGVKLQLAQIFKTPNIRELASFIKHASLKQRHTGIEAVEKKEYYPLSSAQKRLHILQQIDEEGTAYNMPISLLLHEGLDKARLQQMFDMLIKRHESFRTSFELVDGETVQRVHDFDEIQFEIREFDFQDSVTSETFVRPFDLTRAPLLRAAIKTDGSAKRVLMMDMHHIVSDGLSSGILQDNFEAFYRGVQLPPLQLQYKDYSNWQNRERETGSLKQQEEYWVNEFSGKIPVLSLPTDYPRPKSQTFEGKTLQFEISVEENAELHKIALRHGATIFMMYLAIADIFLSKLSGQEDIVIGVPVAGRRYEELQPIIGMFVNTLALRNFPREEKTFTDFLNELKTRSLDAFDNQDFQFEDLVDKVLVTRDPSRNPLFDFLYTLVTDEGRGKKEPARNTPQGITPGWDQINEEMQDATSKFDLKLVGVEEEGKVIFVFEYNTKLFTKETGERFVSYFKNITSAIVANPDGAISGIQMISKEERDRLLKMMRNREDKQFISEIDSDTASHSDSEVEFDF